MASGGSRVVAFFAVLAIAGPSALAHAQTSVSPELFVPAIGPRNFTTVEGARVYEHMAISAGLVIDYANNPFVLYDASCPSMPAATTDCPGGWHFTPRSRVVGDLLSGDLMASLALFRRVQVGLGIPVVYAAGESLTTSNGSGQPVQSIGLSDARLNVKIRIFGGLDRFAVAISPTVTFPLAQALSSNNQAQTGESGVTVHTRAVADFRRNRISAGVNLGFLWRQPVTLYGRTYGSRITFGVAGGYDVTPRGRVVGEIFGQGWFNQELLESPVEWNLGLQYRVKDVLLSLGGGTGLLGGIGSPSFRAFGGALWAPSRVDSDGDGVPDERDLCPGEMEDRDGYMDDDGCPDLDNDSDGIPDSRDRCPNQPEDHDNFEDQDGCPDPDNDHDGIPDGYDSCPNEPETRNGYRDDDGCPDEADRDNDGVPDSRDRCPEEPEDTDGFQDEDGCPDPDNDHDGIPDESDQCPDAAEDRDGFQDEDGCPDPDNDHDSIPDAQDRCRDRAEVWNGNHDEDGCPDSGAPLAVIQDRQIAIPGGLAFGHDSAAFAHHGAQAVMGVLSFILRNGSTIHKVRVFVRAPSDALAVSRASTIRDALVQRGVPADHLETGTAVGADAVVIAILDAPWIEGSPSATSGAGTGGGGAAGHPHGAGTSPSTPTRAAAPTPPASPAAPAEPAAAPEAPPEAGPGGPGPGSAAPDKQPVHRRHHRAPGH